MVEYVMNSLFHRTLVALSCITRTFCLAGLYTITFIFLLYIDSLINHTLCVLAFSGVHSS